MRSTKRDELEDVLRDLHEELRDARYDVDRAWEDVDECEDDEDYDFLMASLEDKQCVVREIKDEIDTIERQLDELDEEEYGS